MYGAMPRCGTLTFEAIQLVLRWLLAKQMCVLRVDVEL